MDRCPYSAFPSRSAWAALLPLLFGCDAGPRRPPLESKSVAIDLGSRPGPASAGVTLADLDGDGLPDIVAGDADGTLFGYRYPGWDRFVLGVDFSGHGLLAADLDGDGRQDIVNQGPRAAWYRNPGLTGPFERHLLLDEPVRGLLPADLDGDGDLDLLARSEGGNSLRILVRLPGGGWSTVEPHGAEPGMGAAVADLDGDGRPEIIGCGEYLTRTGEAGDDIAAGWTRIHAAPWPEDCAAAVLDADRDGYPDLVLASSAREHRLSWFRNPGPGNSGDTWRERPMARALGPVRRLTAADLDGNGTVDILFAEDPAGKAKRPRLGALTDLDGRGGAWSMRLLDDGGAGDIAVGDVGLDGRMEIAAAGRRRGTGLRLLTDLLVEAGRVSVTPATLTAGRRKIPAAPVAALSDFTSDPLRAP